MTTYDLTLYKGNTPVFTWRPGKKEFRVLDPLRLPEEFYLTLIPDTAVDCKNDDRRYEANCRIFAEALKKYRIGYVDGILNAIGACNGTPESVKETWNYLQLNEPLITGHRFQITIGDYDNIQRY